MRSAITAVLASLLLLVVPSAVAAGRSPSPGAPGIGDPYFPTDGNGGYNVSHYGLQVRFQPARRLLTGRAMIQARTTKALSRFDLDLVGLRVDSVRVNGVAASWTRTHHELKVRPRKALAKGHRFVVSVRYHGHPLVI